ncbi:MAG: sialidase family protein [Saprospiraceae bacterium]|nr:sialidase family protein [Saprospiraceae bacterium]
MSDSFLPKKALFTASIAILLSGCASSQKKGSLVNDFPKTFENMLIARAEKGDSHGPCEPSIAVSPKNPQNVAAGAILDRYYWSEDGGRTWENGKLSSKSSGVYGDPVLLADWKGDFYYAHLSNPDGKGWGSPKLLDRIVIQKSTDGGKTYDDGAWCGLRHPKDQDKPWLCADPATGNIACTWTEFDKYASKDLEKDHSRILFSQSTDGGKSWSEALAINQFDGNCIDDDDTPEGAVPAFGPKGEIYVAWAYDEKIWFDRSTDGGKTWLEKDIVAAEQPGGWSIDIAGIGRSNVMPILVCDRSNGPQQGTLYLCWGDQRNGIGDTDIFLAKSLDGGLSWSKPVRVNDDKKGRQQFFPWLAIDQITGHLYVVFYDRRHHNDEHTDVYVAVSCDAGKSFTNLKISTEPFKPSAGVFFGDYNHIAAHDGVVRPIWTRLDKGVLSVWTAIMDFKKPERN